MADYDEVNLQGVMNYTSKTFSFIGSLLLGCFTAAALGACDPAPGDGDGGTSSGGEVCEPGDTQPADDGCNTCHCDDGGGWSCTEIACGDDGGDMGGDAGEGGDAGDGGDACEPGDVRDADDGCNTCTCEDDGTWACTLLGCADDGGGECEPGDTMKAEDECNTCECLEDETWACTDLACPGAECKPGDTMDADDECNTCECLDDGTWACTEIACGGGFPVCEADGASDPFEISAASIVGNSLNMTVHYSGGCAEHEFTICGSGEWAESDPVQTSVTVNHADPGDVCDAYPSENLSFSLLGLQQDYAALYGAGPGTMTVNVTGWGQLEYSF